MLVSAANYKTQPLSIDEYLRERLMPVEGAIPDIPGIKMYGNSVPAGRVGGVKDASTHARHDGIPALQPAFQPTSERSHVCDSLPL